MMWASGGKTLTFTPPLKCEYPNVQFPVDQSDGTMSGVSMRLVNQVEGEIKEV